MDRSSRLGSRGCIESLKGDICTIQAGLRDLLKKIDGLQVPSWRFPEKLATSLEAEELVKGATHCGSEREDCSTHALLLELTVDRLLLLLQCCLWLSDQSLGHRRSGASALPLTLGSAVKKFSKRFMLIRDSLAAQKEEKEVTSKDEKIASLESAMAKLQEHCQLLQDSLHNSIPTVSFTVANSTQSRPATSRATGSGLPPSHGGSRQNRPTSSGIPYEAEGTLKLNHLSKPGRSLSSLVGQKTGEYGDNFHGLSSRSTSEVASVSTPVPNVTDSDKIHVSFQANTSRQNGVSVSTQTIETAFALCARCSETQNCLVSIADRVSVVCSRHTQETEPALAATDWGRLAKVGGLELGEWERALHEDLSTFDGYCCKLEDSCARLALEIDTQKEVIESLQSESSVLTSQINSLRTDSEELRQRSEASLARSKEESTRQQRELQLAVGQLEARNGELAGKLSAVREQEAHLRSCVAQLEYHHSSLQSELAQVQGRELRLESARLGLEGAVGCLRTELQASQGQVEERGRELTKARAHQHSMEKKNKSLQCQLSTLVCRLEEAEGECADFRGALGEATSSREELRGELGRIRGECAGLQAQLAEEKGKLAESVEDQRKLSRLISELEGHLDSVQQQLREERQNCRLLMDYPFIKQTNENYSTRITSLLSKESGRQISANTIRILLLEEQNSELRQKAVEAALDRTRQREGTGVEQKIFRVKGPTPLWQTGLLSKAGHELQPPIPVAAGRRWTPSRSVTTAAHQTRSERQKARNALEKQAPSLQQPTDLEKVSFLQTQTPSSRDEFQVQVGRPPSSSRLRGRLGHLISAIADAHQAATGTNTDCRSTVTAVAPSPGTSNSLTQAQRCAWSATAADDSSRLPEDSRLISHASCTHRDVHSGTNLQAQAEDSPNSSYSDIEVHMCSKCDRMYHCRGDLEKHESLCQV